MIYNRKIYPELLKHAQTPLNTVLTGMRRTGKTTLIRQVLQDLPNKNSLFLDLERPDNREVFLQENYDAIRESLIGRGLDPQQPMVVALDEIQYVKEVPSVIKYLSDHYKIKFVVTGSSSFYLKNVFNESLAGRKKIFELFPLDFGEYLEFKEVDYRAGDWMSSKIKKAEYLRLKGYYEDFIKYGGFPQVVLADSIQDKNDLLAEIMASYINVDVRTLADLGDTRNLYNLTKLLAGRVGSRIEITKLAQMSGLSRPTVTNYLEFLEKTYLISMVTVHTHSVDREIVKAKKLYFGDTGLANHLTELASGAQFENTVFNQLARLGQVEYYALKNGQEVDFIYEKKWAFEVKETPTTSDVSQLTRLADKAGVPNCRLIGRSLNNKYEDYIWGGDIV